MAKPRLVEGLVLSSLLLACASPPKPPDVSATNQLQKPGIKLQDGIPLPNPTTLPVENTVQSIVHDVVDGHEVTYVSMLIDTQNNVIAYDKKNLEAGMKFFKAGALMIVDNEQDEILSREGDWFTIGGFQDVTNSEEYNFRLNMGIIAAIIADSRTQSIDFNDYYRDKTAIENIFAQSIYESYKYTCILSGKTFFEYKTGLYNTFGQWYTGSLEGESGYDGFGDLFSQYGIGLPVPPN